MSLEQISHIILGLFFIFNGVNHFLHLSSLDKEMHHKRTFQTKSLIVVSGVVLIFGGVTLIINKRTFWGSLGIIGFLIAVTPVVHTFWKGDTHSRGHELAHFTKNIAIISELLGGLGH